jgi:hypothetical protein
MKEIPGPSRICSNFQERPRTGFNFFQIQGMSKVCAGSVVSKTKKIQRLSKIFSAYFERLFKDL